MQGTGPRGLGLWILQTTWQRVSGPGSPMQCGYFTSGLSALGAAPGPGTTALDGKQGLADPLAIGRLFPEEQQVPFLWPFYTC